MKIVYFLNYTLPLGGATKSFLILLEGMREKGISPIVVVPNKNGIYETLKQKGINIICVPFRDAIYPWTRNIRDLFFFVPRLLGRIWLNRKALKELQKRLENEKIDIIHSNVSVIDIGYKLSQRLQIPHIYHIREFGDLDFAIHYYPSKRHFQKMLNSTASYSVCITKAIQRYHRLSSNPSSTVIYNGIHHAIDSKYDHEKKNGSYFLFAGRIEPSKGLDVLLEAYSRYHGSVPLYVAGYYNANSGYYKKIIDIINNKNLSDKVQLLGGRDDIEELMRKALALIVPSHYEAFGRSMAEAMFNQCLVIGHDTEGTKEQFDNGLALTGKEIGLRYSNVENLSKCLVEAELMAPTLYREYTHNALYTVNSLYSNEVYIENIYQLYQSILKK